MSTTTLRELSTSLHLFLGLVAAFAASALICAPAAVGKTYTDVPKTHWAYRAISAVTLANLSTSTYWRNHFAWGRRLLTRDELTIPEGPAE